MSNAKAKLKGNTIFLPLHYSQGGIRIADKNGNHFSSPTRTIRNKEYYVERMRLSEVSRSKILGFFAGKSKIIAVMW